MHYVRCGTTEARTRVCGDLKDLSMYGAGKDYRFRDNDWILAMPTQSDRLQMIAHLVLPTRKDTKIRRPR